MKNFLVTQQFDASSHAVHAAYRQEKTWRSFAELPFVGNPVMQSFAEGRLVEVAMAYQVSIDLPPLAHRFIDADKMTFVERTTLNGDGSGRFEIVPDHYTSLLTATGRIEMVSFDERRCERHIQGSIDVNLGWAGKLFEAPVEDAIVNGFTEALVAQATQVKIS